MDKKDIKDTLKAAYEYLTQLKRLQTELSSAEQQIHKTTEASENKIKFVFENLIAALTTSLTNRQNELITEIKIIKQNTSGPLQESQILISNKIKSTITFVDEVNKLIDDETTQFQTEEFNQKCSLLGSLPEVPSLKEVPYVSFQHCSVDEQHIIDVCKKLGSLLHIAPVQISTMLERPGALLIDWSVSDSEERCVEKYHLQKMFGEISTNPNCNSYHTTYIGPSTQYLIKGLNPNQNYTFRVCCKFESDDKWSPWSVPQTNKTSVKPLCWEVNENFVLSNDNTVASPLRIDSMLYSKEIPFSIGYSVELTFLECDNLNNSFIGLFTSNERTKFLLNRANVCFETNGNIYGSGIKKAMQFSPVCKGAKICFTCECNGKDKQRIDIDCGNSRVSYDWFVAKKYIYIGAQLNSSKWKIMID
ncbi:hypothetical protein RN001_006990 [Aquatica leii]|uniref:Fibronectin type-III domain-containing protein n=1 Tax=Aquatica leii TaxID=1421715 RepID=A0AAN7PLN7_9COLE|nr:hypothetical protein RN001_006990 [Aquatica leii]